MTQQFDTIILGGNFCGMCAAYALREKGEQVQLVETGGRLGGFMIPLERGEYRLDKGPQFLDNFDDADKTFIESLLDEDVLVDLGFEYASYSDGVLTEDFAVPDWRRLGTERTREIFFALLEDRLAPDRADRVAAAATFGDVLKLDGGEHLGPTLEQYCEKFLQADPQALAPEASIVTTFLGRKLLFDQDMSVALKVAPTLDDLLVARKHTFGKRIYNLYARGQNLETVRARMDARMHETGVDVRTKTRIASVAKENGHLALETTDGERLLANRVLVAYDIRLAEPMLLGSTTLQEHSHLLPEIFYFFVVDRDAVHPSYYIQDYDLEHRVSRITNMANYMGSAAGRDLGVICAEVPAMQDDPWYQDPDAHIEQVWREVREAGAATADYTDAWAMPVPVTYKLGKASYPAEEAAVLAAIEERFEGRVVVPETNRLTRQQTLAALRGAGILED